VIRYLTENHDRIAQRMNDVVVRRIFAAGLDLQAGLGLIGDHRGASKTYHANCRCATRSGSPRGDSGLPDANWSSQRPTTASGRQECRHRERTGAA
jgi:hypothetical protein